MFRNLFVGDWDTSHAPRTRMQKQKKMGENTKDMLKLPEAVTETFWRNKKKPFLVTAYTLSEGGGTFASVSPTEKAVATVEPFSDLSVLSSVSTSTAITTSSQASLSCWDGCTVKQKWSFSTKKIALLEGFLNKSLQTLIQALTLRLAQTKHSDGLK